MVPYGFGAFEANSRIISGYDDDELDSEEDSELQDDQDIGI
jgi:hypothetical protein